MLYSVYSCIAVYAEYAVYAVYPDRRAGTMIGACIAVAYSEILYRKLYSDVMYRSPRGTVYETLWRL